MSRPEPGEGEGGPAQEPEPAQESEEGGGRVGPPVVAPARYGRYVGLLALVILALITINTLRTKPTGDAGIPPGQKLAPFAVPLALSTLEGTADVARHANQGSAGRVPACRERGSEILNVCELYEQGPLVLALFVDSGSCRAVLSDLQALAPSFPGVRFAAVAIKAHRSQLRRLIRSRGVTLPVGIDEDGRLAALYSVASCPQVSFAYPGGVVQSKAVYRPSRATLRVRISALVAASRARGWRGSQG